MILYAKQRKVIKKLFLKPEHSKKYIFLAKCIENIVNKIEENEPEKLKKKLLITDYSKVKKIKNKNGGN